MEIGEVVEIAMFSSPGYFFTPDLNYREEEK